MPITREDLLGLVAFISDPFTFELKAKGQNRRLRVIYPHQEAAIRLGARIAHFSPVIISHDFGFSTIPGGNQ